MSNTKSQFEITETFIRFKDGTDKLYSIYRPSSSDEFDRYRSKEDVEKLLKLEKEELLRKMNKSLKDIQQVFIRVTTVERTEEINEPHSYKREQRVIEVREINVPDRDLVTKEEAVAIYKAYKNKERPISSVFDEIMNGQ